MRRCGQDASGGSSRRSVEAAQRGREMRAGTSERQATVACFYWVVAAEDTRDPCLVCKSLGPENFLT